MRYTMFFRVKIVEKPYISKIKLIVKSKLSYVDEPRILMRC